MTKGQGGVFKKVYKLFGQAGIGNMDSRAGIETPEFEVDLLRGCLMVVRIHTVYNFKANCFWRVETNDAPQVIEIGYTLPGQF